MRKTTLLKKMIMERKALVVPGAYDALSAILIEKTGFKALQVSGFGMFIITQELHTLSKKSKVRANS